MSLLNYNHLRYFWAVAHDGNLTRAAEQLNLSQSALSVQVKKLEQQLGHALFERRNRQLHLTEAGRIALDHADAIFSSGDDLLSTLKERGRARVALRIGALATLSRNFQLSFIRPILGRSDVEVILRSGGSTELFQALETHQLDVVLTNHALMRDALTSYVTHRISEQSVSLVCRPNMAQSQAGGRTGGKTGGGTGELAGIEELMAHHPMVLPAQPSAVRQDFDAYLARLGLRPQIAAEVDDMAMMRLLVREGVGIGVLPPIVVKDELASGLLVEAAQLPGLSEVFYAMTAERRFPNPFLRSLLGGA
jgi:LysR family transcriptional regulator, transcriptional activator of nhaA